jgi:hypothetical protein
MKQFFKFSYQAEIRLSFLLFILFFLLINFEVVYLLNLSKEGWNEESQQNLKGGAYSVSQLWQNNSGKLELGVKIKSLLSLWGLKSVDILNQNRDLLFSSDDKTDIGWSQSADSSLNLFKSRLSSGKSFFSEIYPGSQKRF